MENGRSPVDTAEKHVKGMSIRALGAIMVAAAVFAILFSLFELQQAITHANSLYELEQERIRCDQAIQQLMDGSDYLTEQVQQFVIHAERCYMDNYWTEIYVTRSRDRALSVIQNVNLTDEEHQAAEDGKTASDKLVGGEIRAMRLVSESMGIAQRDMPADVAAYTLPPEDASLSAAEKRDAAIDYVFGPDYSFAKDSIRANVNSFRNEISNRYAEETIAALESAERTNGFISVGLVVFFALLLIAIFCFMSQVVSPLIAYSAELSRDSDGGMTLLRERGARELRRFAASFNMLCGEVEHNTERLARLGYIDYLTDVPNRASITEFVLNLIREGDSPAGLMIIDIDDFKHFNDTYGHALGDQVLQRVAKAVCSAQSADAGISGRLCGEEFIVVSRHADERSLAATAERILENVRHITGADVRLPLERNFRITVSVGGMLWRGEQPADFISLLSKADKALYISKKTGKDKYTFNDGKIEA